MINVDKFFGFNDQEQVCLSFLLLAIYTSAGKTALFNALTGESKMEGKEMFTTLSTFTRAIDLKNDKKILISDTVGFVSKLQLAYIINAFKSTLQDITYSVLFCL
jgi:GTPase